MKYKLLLIAACFLGSNVNAFAQRDTLQNYPFLYLYNLPMTDSISCPVKDDETDVIRLIGQYPQEFASLQHTDDRLRAIGIAIGVFRWAEQPALYRLSLSDTSMKASGIAYINEFYTNW